jgi:predicted RNase H-like HicB family nuclease
MHDPGSAPSGEGESLKDQASTPSGTSGVKKDAYCSFCRKSERDVAPLVEGPGDVYICGECIELSQYLLNQERRRRAKQSAPDVNPPGSASEVKKQAFCSFCRKEHRDVGPLVEGPSEVYICGECLKFCQAMLGEVRRHPEESARYYVKLIQWSDESGCFVGQCPSIIGPCCHGDDEAAVYAELCQIVVECIGRMKIYGEPLPPPTIGRDLAQKLLQHPKESARYVKVIEWSSEEGCFVGQCPGIIAPCCHGDDEAAVYAELCQIVEDSIDAMKSRGEPLPPPTIGRNLAQKLLT